METQDSSDRFIASLTGGQDLLGSWDGQEDQSMLTISLLVLCVLTADVKYVYF